MNQPTGHHPQEPAEPCARRECILLLVEDNEADIDLLMMAFEQRGFHANITTFRDGGSAWRYLENLALTGAQPPDIILLDDQLPVLSGSELFKRIEATPHFATTVTTIFSANDSSQLARRGIRPDAIIPKPVDWAGYGKVFDRVLDLLKHVPCTLTKLDR